MTHPPKIDLDKIWAEERRDEPTMQDMMRFRKMVEDALCTCCGVGVILVQGQYWLAVKAAGELTIREIAFVDA